MTQPVNNFNEPGWWGVCVLIVLIAALVYFLGSCAAKGVEYREQQDQENRQSVTTGDNSNVTILSMQNAGKATIAVTGIGLITSLLAARTRRRAVDRLTQCIERAASAGVPGAGSIKAAVRNSGASDRGPDAVERYINGRVTKCCL